MENNFVDDPFLSLKQNIDNFKYIGTNVYDNYMK